MVGSKECAREIQEKKYSTGFCSPPLKPLHPSLFSILFQEQHSKLWY